MNGTEVLEFTDKGRRDDVFDQLRTNGFPNERQVVKFSGNKPVMITQDEFKTDEQGRIEYISTWSVAYPREDSSYAGLKA